MLIRKYISHLTMISLLTFSACVLDGCALYDNEETEIVPLTKDNLEFIKICLAREDTPRVTAKMKPWNRAHLEEILKYGLPQNYTKVKGAISEFPATLPANNSDVQSECYYFVRGQGAHGDESPLEW